MFLNCGKSASCAQNARPYIDLRLINYYSIVDYRPFALFDVRRPQEVFDIMATALEIYGDAAVMKEMQATAVFVAYEFLWKEGKPRTYQKLRKKAKDVADNDRIVDLTGERGMTMQQRLLITYSWQHLPI